MKFYVSQTLILKGFIFNFTNYISIKGEFYSKYKGGKLMAKSTINFRKGVNVLELTEGELISVLTALGAVTSYYEQLIQSKDENTMSNQDKVRYVDMKKLYEQLAY